jgi:hypothetical protein
MNAVPSQQRERQIESVTLIMHPKTDPLQPTTFDRIRPEIRCRVETIEEWAGARHLRHCAHPQVIDVEDCKPIVGQRLRQLAFGALDRFDAPHPLKVRRSDIGHDSEAWPGKSRQMRDLTRTVHAHFQHCHLMVGGQFEQHDGQ